MPVYLIHFSKPISPKHTCQHYIGWTPGDVLSRLALHKMGRGARLTTVANERGIDYDVVAVWEDGNRTLERKLKNRHGSRLCPVCNAKPEVQPELPFYDIDMVPEIAF